MEVSGEQRRLGLPARLRRLRALVAQADRRRRSRASGISRIAPTAPRRWRGGSRRSRPAGSRARGSTATSGTARPTASSTPTATASSSSTSRSATTAPPELRPALKNQPHRYPGRGVGVRHLDHVNFLAVDPGENRVFCEQLPRPAADRADRARRRHRGGRVARVEPEVVRPHLHARRHGHARPAAPHRVLRRPARGRAARGGHLPRARDRDGVGPAQARDPADVLPLHVRARREPHRGLRGRLPDLRPRSRAGRLDAGRARQGPGVGHADGRRRSTSRGRRRCPRRTCFLPAAGH